MILTQIERQNSAMRKFHTAFMRVCIIIILSFSNIYTGWSFNLPPSVIDSLPLAFDDSVSTNANHNIVIAVLENDAINGTVEDVNIISLLKGTAVVTEDFKVLYITPTDYCGKSDTFRYAICNATGCDTAEVIVNLICPDALIKRPIALDDAFSVDTSVIASSYFVAENDTIWGKNIDTLYVVTHPRYGTASNINLYKDRIVYMPAKECHYTDTIEYAICTSDGCDTAKVFITVTCPQKQEKPLAQNDKSEVQFGKMVIIDVATNDSYNGSDTFKIKTHPKRGVANFDNFRRIYYTSDSMTCGIDTMAYEICNNGGCALAIVTIKVLCPSPETLPPDAANDIASGKINKGVIIRIFDNDKRRNAQYAEIKTAPKHGTIEPALKTTTEFVYLPNIDMWGRDSFQYQICNDYGCDSAWVQVYTDPGEKILVYSGFSPNGDKINDFFYIKGIDAYPNNEVIVFNRYGNEVFKKKGYKNDDAWNGDWHGLSLPVGTYYYIVTIHDEITSQYSGYIQIHR